METKGMDESEFNRLIAKAERAANRNLDDYKAELALIAVLGYAIIPAVIVAIIFLLVFIIWSIFNGVNHSLLFSRLHFIVLSIPMLWVMVRAVWMKVEVPEGYELKRESHPRLFAEIDQLSHRLQSLRVHKVLLSEGFNACVVQTPKHGLIGRQINTLILGLELLLALTPDQARSVLAHELGHLSENHSRFAGWIYRVRESWQRVQEGLAEKDHFGAQLMQRFFDWYAPRFVAYSFPLARHNEYDADAIAAKLTSAEITADALIKSEVADAYLHEAYWKSFFKQANLVSKPVVMPWAGLDQFLKSRQDPDVEFRLQQALAVETDYTNTHPALQDRLAALKITAKLPSYAEENAARVWFGDEYGRVLSDFDQAWFARNKQKWADQHRYASKSRADLKRLSGKDLAELDNEELWQLGNLQHEFGSQAAAIAAFREYYRRMPDEPKSAFALAHYMAEANHEVCLSLYKKAMKSPDLALDACRAAYNFLMSRGDQKQADEWRDRYQKMQEELHRQSLPRQRISIHDRLTKPDLKDKHVALVINRLKLSKRFAHAWIAEKIIDETNVGTVPALAVAVKVKGITFSEEKLQRQLSRKFSDLDIWIFSMSGEQKPLAEEIKHSGTKVF